MLVGLDARDMARRRSGRIMANTAPWSGPAIEPDARLATREPIEANRERKRNYADDGSTAGDRARAGSGEGRTTTFGHIPSTAATDARQLSGRGGSHAGRKPMSDFRGRLTSPKISPPDRAAGEGGINARIDAITQGRVECYVRCKAPAFFVQGNF